MSAHTAIEAAAMIAPVEASGPAPLFRREFALDDGHGAVLDARLRISAHGVFEAWINGALVSDELLAPGWTSYEWRLRAEEYDVAALLAERSALCIAVGRGWFSGRLGFTQARALYGADRAAWAHLRIRFEDGHVQEVRTDASWEHTSGEVLGDDLYDGQVIDARRRDASRLLPGWRGERLPVRAVAFDAAGLVPRTSPPVRRLMELPVQRAWTSPSGATLIDVGQNIVGFLRVRVTGPAGTEVVVRHSEVLEHDELGVRPLRTAAATDRFILSGGDDVFEPTLTFHGFRYAQVDGWPGELDPAAIAAIVIGSDVRTTGEFSCSDPLITQLHRNVVWGMRGNFLSVPTDCPQRDERLGWTGDLSVFASTAAFLGDVESFLADWLVDVRLEQLANRGDVPMVVPDAIKYLDTGFPNPGTAAIWSDAAVWVPWALWRAYGHDRVLRDAYPLMTQHTRRVASLLSPNGVWDTGFQFGDWLDPDAPPDDPGKAKADPGVVATACTYRTARTMADTAIVLGEHADAAEFTALAGRIRSAFVDAYVADGRVASDCVTVYALAIAFGLLEGAARDAAGDRLAELVAASGFRIATGFAGTPFVCDALTETGHLDSAYRLLQQTEMPSWLYPVTMGATTVWERWDSMLPDGSINPGEMTSFNHYALGSVADWLHRTVGGIDVVDPGYARFRIAPRPGGTLTSAHVGLITPRGRAAVAWELRGDELAVVATVPDGSVGVVDIPGFPADELGAGVHRLTGPWPA